MSCRVFIDVSLRLLLRLHVHNIAHALVRASLCQLRLVSVTGVLPQVLHNKLVSCNSRSVEGG
eukprot:scaffold7339_cov249-Pinguiococcus_pyrenoidosus.AAC.14